MSRRVLSRVPATVKKVSARLEEHRARHGKGRRIPEELWQSAARAAQEHGVSLVARALGLDYYSLKERASASGEEESSSATFLEFPSPVLAPRESLCAIELETAEGDKMTMRLPSLSGKDAVELATAFWRLTV